MVYPALLPLMRTARLPVVDWTDLMDSSVSPKDEICFLRVCRHVSTDLYRQIISYGVTVNDDMVPNIELRTLWCDTIEILFYLTKIICHLLSLRPFIVQNVAHSGSLTYVRFKSSRKWRMWLFIQIKYPVGRIWRWFSDDAVSLKWQRLIMRICLIQQNCQLPKLCSVCGRFLLRKKLRADWSQEMLAIIRCRIFCLPGCYPKI